MWDHTAYTYRHTNSCFFVPGSAFAALTAAGLTTNLPLAGQAMQIRYTAYAIDSYAVNGYIVDTIMLRGLVKSGECGDWSANVAGLYIRM
jgi:hypothetical protein